MHDVQLEDLDEFPRAGEDYELDEESPRPAHIKGKARRGQVIEITQDQLEDELEMAYKRFQAGRSARHATESKGHKKTHYNDDGVEVDENGDNITHSEKRARARMSSDAQLASLEEEDAALLQSGKGKKQRKNAIGSEDMEAYVTMLTKSTKKTTTDKRKPGEAAEDSSDSDSEDDEFSDREEKKPARGRAGADSNDEEDGDEEEYLGEGYVKSRPGQVVTRDGLSAAGKAAKWFANPIFGSTMVSADDAEVSANKSKGKRDEPESSAKKSGRKRSASEVDDAAASMMDLMPKTDKQARKEQRKKDIERRDRRSQKSTKNVLDEDEQGMLSYFFLRCPFACIFDAAAARLLLL
jgi:hypothetical protein